MVGSGVGKGVRGRRCEAGDEGRCRWDERESVLALRRQQRRQVETEVEKAQQKTSEEKLEI